MTQQRNWYRTRIAGSVLMVALALLAFGLLPCTAPWLRTLWQSWRPVDKFTFATLPPVPPASRSALGRARAGTDHERGTGYLARAPNAAERVCSRVPVPAYGRLPDRKPWTRRGSKNHRLRDSHQMLLRGYTPSRKGHLFGSGQPSRPRNARSALDSDNDPRNNSLSRPKAIHSSRWRKRGPQPRCA